TPTPTPRWRRALWRRRPGNHRWFGQSGAGSKRRECSWRSCRGLVEMLQVLWRSRREEASLTHEITDSPSHEPTSQLIENQRNLRSEFVAGEQVRIEQGAFHEPERRSPSRSVHPFDERA